MGAADAVPGVSGGTIAFITGIYEELINTIKQFGPSALGAWRSGGWTGLARHLNVAFLIPLLSGVAVSLVSVAHLALWLMEAYPLLLEGFFFGLVAASALVVGQAGERWKMWYLLPLLIGLMLAKLLPGMMPLVLMVGNESLVVIVAGAIAISAMLLPGVSGSFLLLTMGLYGTIMGAIRSFDIGIIMLFGMGCVVGLALSSRLLSWLLRRYHGATLQLLLGFIIGSLPVLWPWRELLRYQLGPDGQMIPLAYRYLLPSDYAVLTGASAQVTGVITLMVVGALLVVALNRRATTHAQHHSTDSHSIDR
jgi:putative membrane protein|tara:strand:- start:241 stop:1164 length:924 start_codon:yes stop_codon:yes gene_type:complete